MQKTWLNLDFLHKSFQELFAAFFICAQIQSKEIRPDELVSDPRYFVLVAFWNLRLWQASQLRVSRNSGCRRPFKQINRQFVARYTR